MTSSDAVDAVQTLPSGRSLAVRAADGGEELTVRSPDGALEVQIVLTPAGPVVRVAAARLEVAAAEVAVACDTFRVEAAGEVRMKAGRSVHLNGETIRLNCPDPTEPPATVVLPVVPADS